MSAVANAEAIAALPSPGDDAFDWATEGNVDLIPLDKLENVPSGEGGVRVAATSKLVPTTLYATAAVGSGWRELTLTEDLPTDGGLIEFRIAGTGEGGGEYAIATADEIANTIATAIAPTNYVGALPIKTMAQNDEGFGHDTVIVRKSDEANKIWVRLGRILASTWTIKSFGIVTTVVTRGGAGNALFPRRGLQTWVAEDVDEIVNVEGNAYKIVPDLHAGHGKVATPRTLTHANFVGIVANPAHVTGGVHGHVLLRNGHRRF